MLGTKSGYTVGRLIGGLQPTRSGALRSTRSGLAHPRLCIYSHHRYQLEKPGHGRRCWRVSRAKHWTLLWVGEASPQRCRRDDGRILVRASAHP